MNLRVDFRGDVGVLVFALKRVVTVILIDVREAFGRRRIARYDANFPMVVVDERRGYGA